MRILLVEDELEMAAWLERALAQSGFLPDPAHDARTAEVLLTAHEYDAVVMDLRLPDKHGLVLLREMRERGDHTPVLILTAQGALQDRVRGLNLGADDFLTKPFALEELEARLAALVRRSRGRVAPVVSCGSLEYNPESRAFMLDSAIVHLTPREHAALLVLISRSGMPVEKSQLFARVFEHDSDASPDAIEVVLHRLRKKLANSDVHIVTVRGLGYMLEVLEAESGVS
ncbi:response regulator [Alcaligenes aquatilis]|jgi:two-component system response regulator TctD|uniref:Response regulator n=1 Tax=Alcaligenes aquatilis TaxID=323284 RepID=A0ABY4NEW9_9BURK|nr:MULTISPECIES: response regulator [Alcaligenes]MCC9164177.1 response regulator [Alcaligenes sp. MMA]MCH4225945.1 response regulator [Alcaligenes faecalis]UQN35316.1 response regulator [Alcaligenes aquatilis]